MTRISVGGRATGKVVWCLTRLRSFFTPSPRSAFTQISLHLDRVNFVEGDKDETALAGFEEALGDAGLCAVVANRLRLPMTASRRLQLVAEKSWTLGLVIRRWRRQTEATGIACRR